MSDDTIRLAFFPEGMDEDDLNTAMALRGMKMQKGGNSFIDEIAEKTGLTPAQVRGYEIDPTHANLGDAYLRVTPVGNGYEFHMEFCDSCKNQRVDYTGTCPKCATSYTSKKESR